MTHEEMLEEAARREGTPEAPDANVIITPDLHKDSLDYEDMYYETAHKELLENPRYAVHVHETQINRLIGGIDSNSKDVMVHHAGTKLNENGQLVSNGGRVLSITGISDSLSESAKLSYSLMNKITLNGSHFRKDIGFRTL